MSEGDLQVLLVEDNPRDADLLIEGLSGPDSRFQIVTMACMAEAEQYLKAHRPADVVLLDLGLPDSDGLATLEWAVSAAPRLPIIVLTGLEDEAVAVESLRKGAQDYLIKGEVRSRVLLRAIHHAVERKRLAERAKRQNAVLDGINRIFKDALWCQTEEELGRTCLAVAEEITASRLGFVGEIGADGLLHAIAISDPGWDACKMTDPTGHRRSPGNFVIHGIYGRVSTDGKPVLTNDPGSHPDRIGLPPDHPPLTAFLGVPLVRGSQTIGMIAVANRDGGYEENDVQALEAIAPALVEAFDRKRAEEALRESRSKLEAAFRSMTEAIFIADAQGRLTDFNDGFVRYHRFRNRDECSRTIADCPQYLDAYFDDGTPAPPEMWAMPRAAAKRRRTWSTCFGEKTLVRHGGEATASAPFVTGPAGSLVL